MATRAILLPAGMPQKIVDVYEQAMRDALAEIDANPDLKEKAVEIMGPLDQPAAGAAAIRNVRAAVVFDDAAFQWLKGWLKEKFNTDILGLFVRTEVRLVWLETASRGQQCP